MLSLQPRAGAQVGARRASAVHVVAFALPRIQSAGPGTGGRKSPAQLNQQYTEHSLPAGPLERFDYHSAEDCERLTPLLVRASMPLRPLRDREKPAEVVLREEFEAPATGPRRRPAPSDAEARQAVLAYPSAALQRDVLARHTPEAILNARLRLA